MADNQFLEVALEASKKAEEILLRYYSSGVDYSFKEDNTPVTVADKEAERIILETIKKSFPDHSFLGEETGESGDSEYKWVIDPLDATKSLIRGLPLFSTEIALMKGEELIVGVSNSPALGELYYGVKGQGAFLNGRGIKVSGVDNLKDAYVAFGGLNFFVKSGNLEKLGQFSTQVRNIRDFGDAQNYHYVSQGKIDGAFELDLKIWDIGALTVIIQEAGGVVTDVKGEKIGVNTTSIVASNKLLHQKILEFFK